MATVTLVGEREWLLGQLQRRGMALGRLRGQRWRLVLRVGGMTGQDWVDVLAAVGVDLRTPRHSTRRTSFHWSKRHEVADEAVHQASWPAAIEFADALTGDTRPGSSMWNSAMPRSSANSVACCV